MRRSFRIRRVPGDGTGFWQWECTLCHPPARGGRFGPGAWERIVRTSLPRHMHTRFAHHQHIARTRAVTGAG